MSDDRTTLLVQGLSREGPADIVGAFANEANVDPDAIGEIDMDDHSATVDVASSVADHIMHVLDGGRIGNASVSLTRLDEEAKAAQTYARRLTELVELEREEEMRRHEQEIANLSGRERERRGRGLLHMRGRDEGEGLGGHQVKFMREKKGKPLPDNEIRVGDLVMISKKDPLRDDNPTGTVTQVTKYSVTVSFELKPDGWVFGKGLRPDRREEVVSGLRVDLYVNDVTYQRMQDALQQLPAADGPLAHLRDVCTGISSPAKKEPVDVTDWHNSVLNESQRQAVREALASDDVHLIHGPPGTGKTTTAIEVIRQCVDRGESVLATAASNTAVDTIVEFLVEAGVDVVRLGHPARVTESLQAHTLDAKIADNETYQRSQARREEAFDVLDEQGKYTHPSGRWRRGMSDHKIKELAEEGRGSRGVPAEKIHEMAEWLRLQDRAEELFDEAERLEQKAIAKIIRAADVVCSTNATAGSDLLEPSNPDGETPQVSTFDTLVIDEATQATAPSCWVPMTHAHRALLVGDHKQLPPTILNREAEESGLQYSLFERVAGHHETDPDAVNSVRSLLRTQYRMHEAIMGFSDKTFYDDALKVDESVRNHTLAGLGVRHESLPAERRDILDPDAPVVFADTAGIDARERQRTGSHSRENPREAEIVTKLATDLLDAGVTPDEIAVISPYDDQVDRIENELAEDDLEVDTVDHFQGREKEVVLVSLVRSNPEANIGFLDETRRFNVAVTRARRKVVVVGDSETVSNARVLEAFLRYAENSGRVVRL